MRDGRPCGAETDKKRGRRKSATLSAADRETRGPGSEPAPVPDVRPRQQVLPVTTSPELVAPGVVFTQKVLFDCVWFAVAV